MQDDLVARLRVNDAEIYLPILGQAADRIEALEAENERLREALEEFVASTGVSDDPDILLVEASVYEHATRILGER